MTAYVLRFVNNLKKRVQHLEPAVGSLTHDEINSAKMKWIKDVQYPMSKHANYGKVKDSLNLFEDKENIIRCHGRIQESLFPYDTKFPILLPSDDSFTRLIVLQSHKPSYAQWCSRNSDTGPVQILDHKRSSSRKKDPFKMY